jgi:HlyD family secretion protein
MKRSLIWGVLVLGVLVLAVFAYRYSAGMAVPAYTVHKAPLVQQVVATGRVVPVSTARVATEITGVVSVVHVDEGDRVHAGQPLLELRSDELRARVREASASLEVLRQARRPQAQAKLRQALAQLQQARREADRRRRLSAENAVPREALEQAEQALATAQANADQARLEAESLGKGAPEELILAQRLEQARAELQKATVQATTDGRVLRRNVEPGDLVQPGMALLEVADDQAGLEVLVPVDERNLGVLATGQLATCIADAYLQQPFKAVIKEIAPAIDPQRGTVDVRLRLQDPPDFLRADMTVTATMLTGHRNQALVVPNQALFNQQGHQAQVWRVVQGRASASLVHTGLRGVAFTEVTAGIDEGDQVLLETSLTQGQRVHPVASAAENTSQRRELPVKFN